VKAGRGSESDTVALLGSDRQDQIEQTDLGCRSIANVAGLLHHDPLVSHCLLELGAKQSFELVEGVAIGHLHSCVNGDMSEREKGDPLRVVDLLGVEISGQPHRK
jgi:hypothetical protein